MTPRVHVVMCTYEPDLRHFQEQLDSILAQEGVDLSLSVVDDGSSDDVVAVMSRLCEHEAVRVVEGPRLGVFHNFERGLTLAPAGVEAILLSDQDDLWHPRKAATLVAALHAGPDVLLAHSDARVIDDHGRLVAASMFAAEGRDVERLDMDHLILKNVVTGCATAVRPRLLETALPFPRLGNPAPFHHDLWLAICALSTGRIATVRQPLLDYRQHGANVMGIELKRRRWLDPRRAVLDWRLRRTVAEVAASALESGQLPADGPARAVRSWVGPGGAAHVLRLALTWGLRGDAQASFALLLGLVGLVGVARDRSRVGTAVSLLRAARPVAVGVRRLAADPDARGRLLARLQQGTVPDVVMPDVIGPWPHAARPLPAAPAHRRDRTLHLLVPALPATGVFGGVATAVRLAVELARQGEHVSVVEVDKSDRLPDDELRAAVAGSLGLTAEHLRDVDFQRALGPDERLSVGPADVFIATAWWTALRAHRTSAALGRPDAPFVYLVQDYEPSFYGGSDVQALAQSSYDLPCLPVVNCATLADHLRTVTRLPIDDDLVLVPQVDVGGLAGLPRTGDPAGPLRVLFYGRPSVPRNLFETGLRGLSTWSAGRRDDRPVQVVSVGEPHPPVDLGGGVQATSLGQLTWSQYEQQMSRSHVGLSLMLSPHPSYPPLEMAAAGLTVVTNSFQGKDLSRLTPRILSCAPTALDVARTLAEAEALQPTLGDHGRAFDVRPLGHSLPEVAAALRRRLPQLSATP